MERRDFRRADCSLSMDESDTNEASNLDVLLVERRELYSEVTLSLSLSSRVLFDFDFLVESGVLGPLAFAIGIFNGLEVTSSPLSTVALVSANEADLFRILFGVETGDGLAETTTEDAPLLTGTSHVETLMQVSCSLSLFSEFFRASSCIS